MSAAANSTLGPGMQNNTNISEDVEGDEWISKTPKIVFLAVFLGLGFAGNLFFLLTVSQSRKYRSLAFFIFLSNVAAVNICECLLNMTLLLGSSVIGEWKFGELACRVSSFFVYVIGKETFLALTITTADRFVAIRYRNKYTTVVSRPRIAILITLTWVQSISLSVPIAIGSVPSSVDKYIVYCTLSKGSSIVYAVFSLLLCFIIPIIFIIIFLVKIIRTGCQSGYVIRNLNASQSDNFSDDSMESYRYKQDFQHMNLTGTLCAVWLILEGPYVFTSYYAQFKFSSELSNTTNDETLYEWYVDLVLLWLRFSFAMTLPFIAFMWNKDLWKCGKDFVLCRKNNAVIDESFKKETDSDTVKLERKLKEERLKENDSMVQLREQRVFQVPVLFATSHGVHIKTSNQTGSSEEETDDSASKSATLTGRKCDVVGSRDNLNTVEGDSSEYDSGNEMDPFAVSHPISVKQAYTEERLNDGKRSLSEPAVTRDTNTHNKTTCSRKENISSLNCDSGVDISAPQTVSVNSETDFKVPFRKSQYSNLSEQCADNDGSETCNTAHDNVNQELDSSSITKLTAEIETASTMVDSPLTKRKKKRRKNRAFDVQSMSSVSSNPGLHTRPPARLAPISQHACPIHPCLGRPGHTNNSQNDINNRAEHDALIHSDNHIKDDNVATSVTDKTTVTSSAKDAHDKQIRNGERVNACKSYSASNGELSTKLQLDCDDEVDNATEDILTPSDCRVIDPFTKHSVQARSRHLLQDVSENGVLNPGYDTSGDTTEGSRKRREKLLSSGLLSDGYKRLDQDVTT